MKRYLLLVPVVLVLAGCSAPAPEPVDPNIAACENFAAATVPLLNSMVEGSDSNWSDELTKIDSIALTAEGDVKDRMLAVVNDSPTEGEVFVYEEARVAVNDSILAVERACNAAGVEAVFNQFVIG